MRLIPRNPHPYTHHSAESPGAKGTFAAFCLAISLVLTFGLSAAASAQEAGSKLPAAQGALQKCASMVSLEGRLVMEQWAPSGNCAKPVRTRVTDRFLGFSCLEESPERTTTCRSFVPPPESRAFDTSRMFRCVDMALAPTEAGAVVSRMREWVGPSKECDWSQSLDVLTMEVDFASGEVCAGNLCTFAARLSPIGKVRLRQLVEKALRDLDMASGTASSQLPRAAGAARK